LGRIIFEMIRAKICTCVVSVACLALPICCVGKIPGQYAGDTAIKAVDTLYYLNQHKKDIVQAVHSDMLLQHKYQFVQVEIVKVINPQKYPLIFYVHYQYANKEKILLGSFSLYPSDNPGKFIISTQGKLVKEGSIILSLTTPAKIKTSDKLEVTIKKLTFREK
jgi:hypothetical protein